MSGPDHPSCGEAPRAGAPVALLFSDVEGSSRLWETEPAMPRAIAAHDALVRGVVAQARGRVIKMLGDGVHAVFDDPRDALEAAGALLGALADPRSTAGVALRVRCGIHVGVVEWRDGDVFGAAVNRAARLAAIAHGGQALVSEAAAALVRDRLPAGHALRDLGRVALRDLPRAEHAFQLEGPGLDASFPALRASVVPPGNLPPELTSFVGREAELVELEGLLARRRLLTLVGAGGIGKTRLALRLAQDLAHRFPDGTFLVELAPVRTEDAVAAAVAHALGLRDEPGRTPQQAIAAHCSARTMLLVLDNCEHVSDASARLAHALLREARSLTVLATSREALRVPGEQAYAVPPLSLPGPGDEGHASEAVTLFVDRARLAGARLCAEGPQRASITEICRRLDGLPLAIELAAARAATLAVPDILARLSDRLALLSRGARTALPRQQTLAALVGWSWDLLDAPERTLFARLAAFAGGFDVDAAVDVCASAPLDAACVAELLDSLAAKSLLIAQDGEGGPRHAMLETIRAFAQDRLAAAGEARTVATRHRAWFRSQAARWHAMLVGPAQGDASAAILRDYANLDVAFATACADGDAEGALALAASLYRFWHLAGRMREGRDWLRRALALPGADRAAARDDARYAAGVLAFYQGDLVEARALLEACLAGRRDCGAPPDAIAPALSSLANVLQNQGDLAGAAARQQEALATFRAAGSRAGEGICLVNLGSLAFDAGDLEVAQRRFGEALAAARESGHGALEELALSSLGDIDLLRRRPGAVAHYEQALEVARRIGDRALVAMASAGLGRAQAEAGDRAVGIARIADAVLTLHERGQRHDLVKAAEQLAHALAGDGRAQEAARLLGAAAAERRAHALPVPPVHAEALRALEASLHGALDAAFDAACAQGAAAGTQAMVEVARGCSGAPP